MAISTEQFAAMKSRTDRNRRLVPHDEPQGGGPGCERESTLHNQIISHCRLLGWIYLHGSMAAETHRTLGEPDFVILKPHGLIVLVECKSARGKLSPAQRAFHAHAHRLGHAVFVVRSFAEFYKIVGES
jgi:hypothetical protein